MRDRKIDGRTEGGCKTDKKRGWEVKKSARQTGRQTDRGWGVSKTDRQTDSNRRWGPRGRVRDRQTDRRTEGEGKTQTEGGR